MSGEGVDKNRRRLLTAAAGVMGGAGAAAAAAPFVLSLQPSAKAQAAGAPVEVDISMLEPGQRLTVEWRGKPIWIVRRTKEMLQTLPVLNSVLSDPNSENSLQPKYAKNISRSIKPEILVLTGICTHLGCSPNFRPDMAPADLGADWKGGFFCPCHGSRYDISGRVYSGVPAPTNMDVPPHRYKTESLIQIGIDPEKA